MDKCKLGRAVWLTLDRLGLPPAAVLRQARLPAAEFLGIRGVLVHAISDDARAFYEAVGVLRSPSDPMMLVIGLHDLKYALSS